MQSPVSFFRVLYIQKVVHSQICVLKCSLPSELQLGSVILKYLESCNHWLTDFPWQQFYFMINQLLYIAVIIIRTERHSVTYTHGSNTRTPFLILLSCSLQLLWCHLWFLLSDVFELPDNIDLRGSVHLVINHFGDTIILRNLEAVKDFCRVRFLWHFFFPLKW